MRRAFAILCPTACLAAIAVGQTTMPTELKIVPIDPPEGGFYAKRLDCDGIPIKAAAVVSDAAMVEAHRRLSEQLRHLPTARAMLAEAGAELHIIGKDQVPSDLPELRWWKGKPFDGEQTIDQRTRGVGGLLVSCGEENLLRLPDDRYRGRDICVHEFAHCLRDHGQTDEVRKLFDAQRRASLAKGRWVGAYAGTNDHEFFAELTMWYFGTRGDLGMAGDKPADGREGLRAYDPEAFELFDRYYTGKLDVPVGGGKP